MGVFSELSITPKGSPLDTLCATLEEKMQYEEGERDLVVRIILVLQNSHSRAILTFLFKLLQHKFEIENKDGSTETRTSTLCAYGAPTGSGGYSAMAKLVGIPCGVGKSSGPGHFFSMHNDISNSTSALPGRPTFNHHWHLFKSSPSNHSDKIY